MDPTQTPTQDPVQTIPDFQPKPNYLRTIIFSILIVITFGLITYLFFQNQQLKKQVLNPPVSPTIQAPSPTPKTISSISISPDETAGWKTYTNQKFNFSFMYSPKITNITDTTDSFVDNGINNSMILAQNFDGLTQAGDKPEDFQLMILIANTKGEFNMENLSSPITDIINGIPVTKGITTIKMSTVPAVIFNTSPHKIAFILSTPNTTEKNLFDQILSTFKFTSAN